MKAKTVRNPQPDLKDLFKVVDMKIGAAWHSGRVVVSHPEGCGFDPQPCDRVEVPLSKVLNPQLLLMLRYSVLLLFTRVLFFFAKYQYFI